MINNNQNHTKISTNSLTCNPWVPNPNFKMRPQLVVLYVPSLERQLSHENFRLFGIPLRKKWTEQVSPNPNRYPYPNRNP